MARQVESYDNKNDFKVRQRGRRAERQWSLNWQGRRENKKKRREERGEPLPALRFLNSRNADLDLGGLALLRQECFADLHPVILADLFLHGLVS